MKKNYRLSSTSLVVGIVTVVTTTSLLSLSMIWLTPTTTTTVNTAIILQFLVLLGAHQEQQAAALSMTGQQYFANGTAIAYFDDNTTSKFEHDMASQEGWYYDNTTIFYVGQIPGISSANNVKCSGGYSDNSNSTTIIVNNNSNATHHTFTIINGADVIENKSKAIQPSPIIRIKAGDTVTWTNQDATTHTVTAPPGDFMFDGKIPYGQTFDTILSGTTSTAVEDRSFSCTFTEPGGFHYDVDNANNGIKGVVIVEQR